MGTLINPYQAISLLLHSEFNFEKSIPIALDALENEIQLIALDSNQIFNSTQSRLQYLFSIGKIDKILFRQISSLRIQGFDQKSIDNTYFQSILACWIQCIAIQTKTEIPQEFTTLQFDDQFLLLEDSQATFIESSRISILKFDEIGKNLEFVFENKIADIQILSLDTATEKIVKLFTQASKYLKFPYDVFVHKLSKSNPNWTAKEFIILPDYLIDVTAIASCFNTTGSNPLKHLIHLFYYSPSGYSTLLGTTVNQFLDELILNPSLQFEDLSQNLFQHNPIAFSLLDDSTIIKYFETIKIHFSNIKTLIENKFEHPNLQLEDCILEPSFYSVEYGIQGRLDVFHEDKINSKKWIIELKSGKPYLPNKFGINADHHAQIMLYYLLIQSVFGRNYDVKSHVLYSAQLENALRYAPILDDIKQELIYLRNAIIILHLHLAFRNESDPSLFDILNEKHFQSTESYTKRDAGILLKVYSSLNPLEKDYFKEFTGFIAREQFISKMGRSNLQFTEGLASLWLLNEQEKLKLFMLLPKLVLHQILSSKDDYPILVLKNSSDIELISKFRIGDTLVLYEYPSALQTQIYKCTLIDLEPNTFYVRLRCRQFPKIEDATLKTWNLEQDSMDRSFVNQYQGMIDFAMADSDKRDLILGIKKPHDLNHSLSIGNHKIPEIIQDVLKKIVASKDYFLLWGPPGSGKTSLVIKHLVELLICESNENILLLAYTNRAVDEICEALESIQTACNIEYIRIGSRFAVQPQFRKNLLEEKISHLKTRKQVHQTFKEIRIFTATLASIQGKKELLLLKQFDTVIIDEASQILESQLTGLLTKFKRFILIGDHMQLPAVTAQTEEESQIKSEQLKQNGFQHLSTSYFERMLQNCIDKKWNHAFEMLEYQGRMHQDLMNFPAQSFYENKLKILPSEIENRQSISYAQYFPNLIGIKQPLLASNRVIFIPVIDPNPVFQSKINLQEARMVSFIVQQIFKLYNNNQIEWNAQRLGVITPFRAQISQIKNQILQEGFDSNFLTIDTAERYQGGARDIIILSTVISDESQVLQISSLNKDGIDRKLNVALTRAKEQIIIIGNPNILNNSIIYNKLISCCFELNIAI
ncbi:MAG: AAA family ATPase [Saprospiraceae bacterium]|nr:AAA family ATPase [Saprospiraceae bacterium]